MRIGGPKGSTQSDKWLPFDKPKGTIKDNLQLDRLIKRMTGDSEYLMAFFDMINGSIGAMPYAPSDYSDFLSSIIGKPLALVNVGFSLELASAPLSPQVRISRSQRFLRFNLQHLNTQSLEYPRAKHDSAFRRVVAVSISDQTW